ncbi:Fur family transcriptional regulator [Culicoidibacter larvae]|uniref:Transcriptional repressor n=1 Tax=Culicoidibacter larvae TaxID=2579976 RepID=A0A5R8QHL5_9FIRM|nr:Fur family transcriptional regulator [Culicoidibacter larvae]TLG77170.1 transcriptional repressor [Culicoidibacter larvae]
MRTIPSRSEIEQILREKEIRPSYARVRILEYFYKNHNHPSVGMIYDELHPYIPSLSKTTVYNTLNLFIEHKIIEALGIDLNELRYDIYQQTTHGHFKCESCQKIFDVDLKIDDQISKDLSGFEITEKNIQFKGLCPDCKNT